MKANPLPSFELLHQIFECDFDLGIIRRRRDGKIFGVSSRGYPYVLLDKIYPAHRVIYFMFHGIEPPEIDHIDGDKLNNSINNLRAASRLQNGWNVSARGFVVRGGKNSRNKPYNATITHNGKRCSLGYFATPEEARGAYVAAAKDLRGEFAADRLP